MNDRTGEPLTRLALHSATLPEPVNGPTTSFGIQVALPLESTLEPIHLPAIVDVAVFARDSSGACEPLGSASKAIGSLDWLRVDVPCRGVGDGVWSVEAIIEIRTSGSFGPRQVLRGVSIDRIELRPKAAFSPTESN
jgi:hypothetical protein